MDEDEYESLPENCTTKQIMMAGACAGIMEHCVMYPVDIVKTRLQCLNPEVTGGTRAASQYSSLVRGLNHLLFKEGLSKSMRGVGTVVCGAGPAHALYFGWYEYLKGRLSTEGNGWSNQWAYAISGGTATLLHDMIMTPCDTVKQRLQMFNSPYANACQCVVKMATNEGSRSFYRAYTTQISMNVPHQSIHFMVYEAGQQIFNKEHQYKPWAHCVSGALAGGTAAFVTTPFDVCKTLLNTQEECVVKKFATTSANHQHHITGLWSAAKTVYTYGGGLKGFFKGWQARVLFQMPGTAISWSVYEFFKWYLSRTSKSSPPPPSQPSNADVSLSPSINLPSPTSSLANINTSEQHMDSSPGTIVSYK